MASTSNIKVVCRFRPQNKREMTESGVDIIRYDENGETVFIEGKEFTGNFTFDRVFPSETTQALLFEYAVKSIVDEVLKGYNGTVLAYGQTGSGKTFTMMGPDIEDEVYKGIIPRITEQIFQCIYSAPTHIEFTVQCSFMEIYMEKIRDLLARRYFCLLEIRF
ncbi:hypothetical protein HMI56_007253 [Coelomomyces lativittatus]|nr:hypothetical protein HMI56_007253 [Coelomomyces lativittatus]